MSNRASKEKLINRLIKSPLALPVCLIAAALGATAPIATQTGTVADMIHGVRLADPYRWLENEDDPKVQAWIAAQNRLTRRHLDSLTYRKLVQARLAKLVGATSESYFQLTARGSRVFAICAVPDKQQRMLVSLDQTADPASRKIVFDPNRADPNGHTAIDWYVASPDGSKVAFSLSQNGTEDGTLHVLDVRSGKEIEQPVEHVQYPTAGGSLAWSSDGAGYWYTRYPGPEVAAQERHFNIQVYFHKLGADPKNDALVLGTKDGLERISEVFLDNRYDQPAVMAMVQRGDGNTWAYYLLRPDAQPVCIGTYTDDIVYATVGPDGAVYAISRRNSSNGKIVKLDPAFAPGGLVAAPVIVPESKSAIRSGGAEKGISDLNFSKNRMFVRDIAGGPIRIRAFELSGKPAGTLPMPQLGSNSDIETLANGDVLFDVSTYLQPRYYAVWHPGTGESEATRLKVKSPISFEDATVTREFARSGDGTMIPVNIIMKKSTKRDGSNPVLLFGYGGYGLSQTPNFLGALQRVWLDAGGIYAIANIRGGAEFGENWHRGGMLTKKQNSFDDFAAVAQALVDWHYTNSRRLAFTGSSLGGLLMGAEITQHPALAHAVVSGSGTYDMIRLERDPNGAFNIGEFGTVKDPAQFKALYAYSPYHHVTANTAYPAVLLVAGAHDGRVNPMHSRKFAAALQAGSNSGLPILLRINTNFGHGLDNAMSEVIDEHTDELVFLFDQLGMKMPGANDH
jgi:prolyl oligopeptidase